MPSFEASDRGSFTSVIVGVGPGTNEAEEAIGAAGGRVLARLGWAEAAAALSRQASEPIVVIEADGTDLSVLDGALGPIAAAAEALDLPVIASLTEREIDAVTGAMFGPRFQLLVNPHVEERVAAMLLAARTPVLAERWREGEAARLQRLNDEVARIADVLARLTNRPPAAANETAADRSLAYQPSPVSVTVTPDDVRRAIRARRLRDGFFGAGLFEDPAWDMLLDLFAAELEAVQVSVSSLCIAAAVAPTTALRWIGKLTEAGLFRREADPFDRRRAFIALSEQASGAMRCYVAACRQAGLSPA